MSPQTQNAAARLAQIPMVHSAWSRLSVLYGGTKSRSPGLKCVCEGLESRVTLLGLLACRQVTPVITQLQPQISLANDVACRSLDWLEATFPVLHAPADQVMAGVKSKVLEVRGAVSSVAMGTVQRVMAMLQQAHHRSRGSLDSEVLVERTRRWSPPEDTNADWPVEQVETDRRRLGTLSITLGRRAKVQSAQIMDTLSSSTCHLRVVHTSWLLVAWSLEQLPQWLQQQIVSAFLLLTHMYNSQQRVCLCDTAPPSVVKRNWRAKRPATISGFESGRMGKGC
ncbi:perilipin-2-like isoform X2 [Nerophis ophidion]|uniref:perilipin-2-like isoform X2 n=1 Tax=Nerophis ophidion TaxID=159077 RepID=UPI002ADF9C09|nr:perilipin-2-like isoform X2 [Nerophis ophidion]